MKTIVMSDLHGMLPKVEPCDLVLICGDISPLEIQRSAKAATHWLDNEFLPWVDSLECEKVIMVWGNHDFVGELNPVFEANVNTQNGKLEILTDRGTEYQGFKIWGTPWCPVLYNWAFYADHEDLVKNFDLIPEDTDIIISHCAPKIGRFGTVNQSTAFNFMEDYGCEELTLAIDRVCPKYCFFGHIHSGQHMEEVYNNYTILANTSVLDESYRPTYPYLVINMEPNA